MMAQVCRAGKMPRSWEGICGRSRWQDANVKTPREGDGRASIWAAVDDLVGRAPSIAALAAHRLECYAASRWLTDGRALPANLAAALRHAALLDVAVPLVLTVVRKACDGPLLVLKGPEAAAVYPDPAMRPFGDIDLVVPDSAAVQRSLLAAGFVESGDPRRYVGGPHELPLGRPDIPVLVEVHRVPNWPRWVDTPSADELFAAAVPGRYGIDGVFALPPEHHALVLAAHSWSHGPLATLRDLVDVAATTEKADSAALERLARAWGMQRLWWTTCRIVDALLFEQRPPWELRTWARNLPEVRERTVIASHLGLWLSSFSLLPAHRALPAALWQVGADLTPSPVEGWSSKLRRTRKALRHATATKSTHDATLDPLRDGGARLPPRRRAPASPHPPEREPYGRSDLSAGESSRT
jgi:Uncharacterised nucleotidyltransferase